MGRQAGYADRRDRGFNGTQAPPSGNGRKQQPPEKTHAEEYYYLKQMGTKTPMIVLLEGGEEIRGWVEWYDQDCIKVHRNGAPNLLIYKRCIRYVYKDPEAPLG
ncbi:MAG: RNA chaperone Hfq [Acidobacteria bacterium]|nr:RNA chaperone Hfq [Acidobacteriota bacterium]